MARQGAIDSPPKTPFIMGSECAGDIEQVGEGVENFKVSISTKLLMNLITSARNLNCKQVCFFKFYVYSEFYYEIKIKRNLARETVSLASSVLFEPKED